MTSTGQSFRTSFSPSFLVAVRSNFFSCHDPTLPARLFYVLYVLHRTRLMKYVVSMARQDERGVPRDRVGPSISPRLPVPSVLVNMPNRQLRDLSDNMSALATCNRRETRLCCTSDTSSGRISLRVYPPRPTAANCWLGAWIDG